MRKSRWKLIVSLISLTVTVFAQPVPNPFKVYNPPLVITTAKAIGDEKSYISGEDPQNNAMYRLFESAIGIRFKNKFSAAWQGYTEKIKLGIASNDIPDFFWVSTTEFNLLYKNRMIEDLTSYIEKYATPNVKAMLNYNNGRALSSVRVDGRLYGLPQYVDALNSVNIVYIRQDWLKKLKLAPPKNYNDLIDIARAFVNNDPDGNGDRDTYGFAVGKDRSGLFEGFFNVFGSYPNTNVIKNGKLAPGAIQPETRLVLEKLQGYYKEGLFDPEFAVRDFGKVAETIAQGKAGIIFGEFYFPLFPLWDNVRNDPEADWLGYKIRNVNGSEITPFVSPNVSGYYVVRKGFSNPEALIIMMNHFVEWQYGNYAGAFAKGWDKITNQDERYRNNSPHNWAPYFSDKPTVNLERAKAYAKALETGKTDGMNFGYINQWNSQVKPGINGDPDNWGWAKVYFNGVPEAAGYANYYYDPYNGPPPPTYQRYGANLQKIQTEAFVKIISNAKPISAFDDFVKQYMNLGGSKHIIELNELQK